MGYYENKTIEEIIVSTIDLFFTYLEIIVAFFVTFLMITYGVDILMKTISTPDKTDDRDIEKTF